MAHNGSHRPLDSADERTSLLESAEGAHHQPTVASSIKAIVFASHLNWLLIFSPLGILAGLLQWSEQTTFILNFFALLPLAKLLGVATEELALRTNQTIGALLNATFGNLVEAIVAVLALNSGLIKVVQASLLGSILSNMLLVLGASFFLGGLYHKSQKFNATAAQTSASLFMVTVLAILIPAALGWQQPVGEETDKLILGVSRGTAIVLLFVYVMYLLFQLKTHAELFESPEDETEEPQMTPVVATGLLILSTLLVSANAEYLVDSIEGISEAWHLSETFVGLVLLPIVGNAAEHVTAVTTAMKNKMDLSIGIAVGSSMQIALLVVPICVIAGWILNVPMTLAFGPVETVIMLVSVLVTNSLIVDGESNWLEGIMLLGAYVVVALSFFLIP
ncbi:Sodium/calcium exchanger protein-domain-containing protein [Cladochytrium replicatum]|nr:Sodium/calcium exchanger protein-domain-containing protein [Cladochytrium replicatum]